MRAYRRKKFKLKKYDHGGEHTEDGSELPPEGTMMGDLLRALEASGDKTEYEMTAEEGPFQDWMIKYDATQDQAVDAVRKYYDQYYNLGPARQLLADQLRSQGRDVDPREYAPFTNTRPGEFGEERWDDSTVDVLKALESYGKTSDTLISEYKQSEFDKLKNHLLNFNPRRDDPETYARLKAEYAEDPEYSYHPDDKFAYFKAFPDYDTEKTADGRNISNLSRREIRNLTVDDLAWGKLYAHDYDTRRSMLPGDQRWYAETLIRRTNPTFSKENILKTIEEQPELFSEEDIEDYKGGYGDLPTYFERQLDDILYTMSYEDLANMAIQSRFESSQNVPYTLYPETALTRDIIDPEAESDGKSFYGAYYHKTDDRDPFMVGVGLTPTQQVRDTALEEISHAMDATGMGDRHGQWADNLNLTPGEAEILQDIVNTSWDRYFERNKDIYPGGYEAEFGYSGPGYNSPAEYYRSPTEVLARIRVLKNLSGKLSNYTQEDLDKIEATADTSGHPDKQYARALEQLREAEWFNPGDGFTDEEILKLMNSIYAKGGKMTLKKRNRMKVLKNNA
jgi:hypothetical protein